MVFLKEIVIHVLVFIILIDGHKGFTQDQTTTRPNTLFDDADDIQPQLNNEARAKMMFGKTKAVWVFHLPTGVPQVKSKSSRYYRHFNIFHQSLKKKKPPNKAKEKKIWSYKDQTTWYKSYPDCGGRSQSPVDLPAVGLIKTKGRQLSFINYDIKPRSFKFENDGKRLILYGDWPRDQIPVVYGGAAHSRRYLFHSMTLHWPSEHRVGGLQYPFETQVIHISAEHRTLQDAINAVPHDSQAILGIVNLYKFSNCTQRGLSELLRMAVNNSCVRNCMCNLPLSCINPPLSEHVCYQGSLTSPPCTENVLWLIRARALSITRESVDMFNNMFGERVLRGSFIRQPQPLNDRKKRNLYDSNQNSATVRLKLSQQDKI